MLTVEHLARRNGLTVKGEAVPFVASFHDWQGNLDITPGPAYGGWCDTYPHHSRSMRSVGGLGYVFFKLDRFAQWCSTAVWIRVPDEALTPALVTRRTFSPSSGAVGYLVSSKMGTIQQATAVRFGARWGDETHPALSLRFPEGRMSRLNPWRMDPGDIGVVAWYRFTSGPFGKCLYPELVTESVVRRISESLSREPEARPLY